MTYASTNAAGLFDSKRGYTGVVFRYHLVRTLMQMARFLLRLRLDVFGLEHLPAMGPYIVVLNHNSAADTPLLLLAFPAMKWRFFAVGKWRYHPLFGPIMGWLGAIYIDRVETDRRKLKRAFDALEEGTVFGLAPEGTRSHSGSLMKAKEGAAYLASRSGAPIVPVGIVNSDSLFRNVWKLRSTRITVDIGEPFKLPDLGRRVKSGDLAALTHYIMIHLAALLPEGYRGYYADSPALDALQANIDPWPASQTAEAR